jgi:hypothetical protein
MKVAQSQYFKVSILETPVTLDRLSCDRVQPCLLPNHSGFFASQSRGNPAKARTTMRAMVFDGLLRATGAVNGHGYVSPREAHNRYLTTFMRTNRLDCPPLAMVGVEDAAEVAEVG